MLTQAEVAAAQPNLTTSKVWTWFNLIRNESPTFAASPSAYHDLLDKLNELLVTTGDPEEEQRARQMDGALKKLEELATIGYPIVSTSGGSAGGVKFDVKQNRVYWIEYAFQSLYDEIPVPTADTAYAAILYGRINSATLCYCSRRDTNLGRCCGSCPGRCTC